MPAGDEVARISVGGKKPMQMYCHVIPLCRCEVATNRLATTVITTPASSTGERVDEPS
jgi:hypothetical protein